MMLRRILIALVIALCLFIGYLVIGVVSTPDHGDTQPRASIISTLDPWAQGLVLIGMAGMMYTSAAYMIRLCIALQRMPSLPVPPPTNPPVLPVRNAPATLVIIIPPKKLPLDPNNRDDIRHMLRSPDDAGGYHVD